MRRRSAPAWRGSWSGRSDPGSGCNLRVHVAGLLLDGERESVQPLAGRLGATDKGQAPHRFVAHSPWAHANLLAAMAREARPTLAMSARLDHRRDELPPRRGHALRRRGAPGLRSPERDRQLSGGGELTLRSGFLGTERRRGLGQALVFTTRMDRRPRPPGAGALADRTGPPRTRRRTGPGPLRGPLLAGLASPRGPDLPGPPLLAAGTPPPARREGHAKNRDEPPVRESLPQTRRRLHAALVRKPCARCPWCHTRLDTSLQSDK